MPDVGEQIIKMAPAVIVAGGAAYVGKRLLRKPKRRRARSTRRDYYCGKCRHVHRYGSRIHKEHQCYRKGG